MRLNHIDLHVSDVSAARAFFVMHFDFHCSYQRGDQIALLEDESGFSLAVSNLFGSPPPAYPPDFHIGFVLESESQLRVFYERMKHAGVPMRSELSRGGPNLYFVCTGPDGIAIEVSASYDQS